MELSTEMWIDVALNATGYLAAGALATVMYSLFRRRQVSATIPAEGCQSVEQQVSQGSDELSSATNSLEYVEFGSGAERQAERTINGESATRRRNRGEVIRLARQMVDAGTPEEKIRDLLPISEAELSLLSLKK
ncbi:MAG: hypothetical protein KAT79_06530 [candidate division Zixibacteria bacterium]|nr:hypothetical protein [candidate division Zixibacteria bacterium]